MPPATQCSHELRVELFIRNRRAMLLTGGAPAAFANAVLDALWPLGIIHVDPPFTSENFGKRSSEQRPESMAHSLFEVLGPSAEHGFHPAIRGTVYPIIRLSLTEPDALSPLQLQGGRLFFAAVLLATNSC